MVDRVSQELQINASEKVQARGSQANYVGPDADKYATSGVMKVASVDDSVGSRILARLAATGDKLAGQAVERSMSEAYLDGVAKAGTIQSEKELQGDVLMRDWQVAGYRDTMGRIASADREAQIATDMPRLREQSPEKFAEYLAENRKALMSQFEGMSIEARKSTFSQQMMVERSAVRKHATEHYKFGVETEAKSIKTAVDVSIAALNGAKDNKSAYDAATDATFATAYSAIVVNPKLPNQMRGKMLAEMATYALESDNQALYEKIHNTVVLHADGREAPMSSLMSWDDNVSLSKAFGASMKRTEAFRAADYMDRTAKFKADWDSPNTPLMPLEAVRAHLAEGIQRNLVSADQYQSLMNDYYEKSAAKQSSSSLAQAYASGDQSGMLSLGKTSQEGLNAWVETMGRKMSLPQVVDNLFTIGAQTGQGNAFRKVGELLTPAFAQIGNNDKIDPANAVAISQTLQRLDKVEQGGQSGAFHQFLSAFDPEVQAKITYMRDNLRKGNDPTTAIAAATARVLEDAKMTPAMRAELAGANAKEIVKSVQELEPRGMFDTAVLGVKSLFSPEAANELALTTRRQWFENEDRVQEVMAGAKLAVAQKMTDISNANPHMAVSSVRSMALADVANRTVKTEWGPLVVPNGFTPQRFFKVADNVGTERIGAALQEYIKPAPGNRVAFSIGVAGQLMFQELNEAGKAAAPKRILDVNSVAPMVQDQRQKQADTFRMDHGDGVTKDVNGVKVQYNGDNTFAVDNGWVRRFRDNLVNHEGVRGEVYKDEQGNEIVGIGTLVRQAGSKVNVGYIKPDASGKVSSQQINDAFMRQSDRAVNAAKRAQGITGVRNEASFQFYAELAYQRGPGFAALKEYQPLLQAVRAKDYPAAEAVFKTLGVYKNSQEARRQHYLNSLKLALKG